MTKTSNIKYSPSLSIAENAERNGVNEDAIRYYIRTRGIDRRYEEKKRVLKSMKDYLKEHPNASKAEVARQSGRGINTVVRYWNILQGKAKLQPRARKSDTREQKISALNKKQIAYLDKLPIEFIREYLLQRESQAAPIVKCDVAKPQPVSVEVPLTAEDLSSEEQSKRAATMLLNRAKHKAQGKNIILDGVELKYEKRTYPIDDVILYSSKVEPENRMLGHHYECLITFRGVEFYGVEQMHSALKFNERPYILNDIMTADSGVQAKSRSHKYAKMYLYDSDYNLKDARITALCFLFKYLSVKEYRDRMRELRDKILFENKGAYEGGNRMNEDKTMLIGNNGDGRSMMAVRDMMLKYEDEAIAEAEQKKGCSLTDVEREEVLNGVLVAVRRKFESDPQVKADSDNVIEYIKTHTDIIPLKRYWPGENAKAIIVSKFLKKSEFIKVSYLCFTAECRKHCTVKLEWTCSRCNDCLCFITSILYVFIMNTYRYCRMCICHITKFIVCFLNCFSTFFIISKAAVKIVADFILDFITDGICSLILKLCHIAAYNIRPAA